MIAAAKEFIGSQKRGAFTGYIAAPDTFALIAIPDGITHTEGPKKIEEILHTLQESSPTSLNEFEKIWTDVLMKCELPAHVSIAAGMIRDNVLYVKTVGNGRIYFRRSKDLQLLLSGDKAASGMVEDFDCAIFTTDQIEEVIGKEEDLKAFVDMYAPDDIVERMEAEEYKEEADGFGVLFVEFSSEVSRSAAGPPAHIQGVIPPQEIAADVSEEYGKSTTPSEGIFKCTKNALQSRSRRVLATIVVIVLCGILVWSVVFGYQRRSLAKLREHIATTSEVVDTKIKDATDEAYLDLDAAVSILREAKIEVDTLKNEASGREQNSINALYAKLQNAEATITKKETKQSTEWYDLALEQKDAHADAIAYDDGEVTLLDTKAHTVYRLDLKTKKITRYTSTDINGATKIAFGNDHIYVLVPKKGIFEFTSETKTRKVIDAKSEWKNPSSFQLYASNIYLLDSGAQTIIKYPGSGSGFGEGVEYIQDGSSISGASAIAIDSSMYAVSADSVFKFTRGSTDSFQFAPPKDTSGKWDQIYTDPDFDSVLVCVSSKGICVLTDKKGAYQSQFATASLNRNAGVFVYDSKAYIINGSKVYTVDLK